MLRVLGRFKVSMLLLAVVAATVLVMLRAGSPVLLFFTLPFMVWIFAIYFFEEVGENVAVLMVVDPEEGAAFSMASIIHNMEPVEDSGWVVETGKFTVTSPYLVKAKTSFMLGLPSVYFFIANKDNVKEHEGTLVALASMKSDEKSAEVVKQLSKAFLAAQQQLAQSYSPQYVKNLEKLLEKMRSEAEEAALVAVKSLHFATHNVQARTGVVVAAAAAAALLLALLILMVVVW